MSEYAAGFRDRRSGDNAPHLSLILPAYNAADYIEENVCEVVRTLESIGRPFEVLLVCDGDGDGTADRARLVTDARVRVLSYAENRGKGYAVCFGVSHAHGRLIGWLDADLDIAPQVIVDSVRRFDERHIDAVVGSKRHPESEVSYPLIRRGLSRCFQLMIRVLFRINVSDTQVGAKVFRGEMLSIVAPLLLIKQYAFDLEVLAVAAEFGFDRIEEVPVHLDYRFSGTGINTQAVRRMFIDTLAIAYRIYIRHWYVRQFAQLQRRRMDAAASSSDAPVPGDTTMHEVLTALTGADE
jgi:glycosyltransferase involved in cell wall biosynthesis